MKSTLLLLIVVCVCTAIATTSSYASEIDCTSRYAGRQLGPKLLSAILVDHQAWFTEALEKAARFDNRDPRRANLCRANLAGVNLQHAFLDRALLQHINLHGADLRQADLSSANLQSADLSQSRLQRAYLIKADLEQANLSGSQLQHAVADGATFDQADLSHTNLDQANFVAVTLRHTSLHSANMRQTNLYKASMDGATLNHADLLEVIFEPKRHALPHLQSLATAKNLANMSFATLPHALEALRQALQHAGMHEQERQIAIAIRRTVQQKIDQRPWRRSMFKGFLPPQE